MGFLSMKRLKNSWGEWDPPQTKEFNPLYVLYDRIADKPIGWYGITETERMDSDIAEFLKTHPSHKEKDLSIAFDKFGVTLPQINKTEDWI
jgi:hypothetical protein